MLNSIAHQVQPRWWYPTTYVGQPSVKFNNSSKAANLFLVPGWLLKSLKARDINLIDVIEKGKANEFLSPEELAHVEALSPFFGNYKRTEYMVNGKKFTSPFKDIFVYRHTWIDKQTGLNYNEFADVLAGSEEIRNTVANKLFREAPAFSDRKEEKTYSFVKGSKAVWIVIHEGFLYEMTQQSEQKLFFEDYLRFVTKHCSIHELARSSPFFAEAIERL